MNGPDRLDTSRLAQWWITIDRTMLAVVLLLLCVGGVLLFAAGPATAARLGISNSFHFSIRQFIFLVPALVAIFGVSMLSPLSARRLGSFMLIGAFVISPLGIGEIDVAFSDLRILGLALAAGLLSNIVPYVIDQFVMKEITRSRFAFLQALLPVTATVVGFLSLGQSPSWAECLGIGSVILAIAISGGDREFRK